MSDSDFLAHAPGCFSSALLYKPLTVECRTCMFVKDCGPRSILRLEKLRAEFGIVVPSSTKSKTTAEPDQSGLCGTPKKVAELMERFERANIFVSRLTKGENPFDARKKPAFLFIACHLLLRGGSQSKETLAYAFETKFGWAPATARSHVLQTYQVLIGLGACVESNGILKIRKNV
jgi:hypothetical protein